MADASEPPVALVTLDIVELTETLGHGEAAPAAAVLARLVGEEERLVLDNRMLPYLDKVPGVVQALPARRAAALLDLLPTATVARALFGNFTRIPDEALRGVIGAMAPERAAALIGVMAVGIDAPREMARVLSEGDGSGLGPALGRAHPAALLRLLGEIDDSGQARIVERAGRVQAVAVASALTATGNRVHAAWGAELEAVASAAGTAGGARDSVPSPRPSPRELRSEVTGRPAQDAASIVAAAPPRHAAFVLRMVSAPLAAELLIELARRDAPLAADLLDAVNVEVLVRPPHGDSVVLWLQDCPAAGIVEALDIGDRIARDLLAAVRPDRLELILDRVAGPTRVRVEEVLASVGARHLNFSFEILGVAQGQRRTRRLDGDLRWVHIDEVLDTGVIRKPVIADLLEVPTERVRLSARMAVNDERALPASRATEVFEGYRRAGERPSSAAFANAGLTQLSRAVEAAGALAAINGNFYFDYGHYLNGVTLGIDVANVPGLFFGDPIGWFVTGGSQLIPPAFNRAAGLITEDGMIHIERVFMTDVGLADGRRARWDALNVPKSPGQTTMYTSLSGYRTDEATTHVDVAIAREQVWSVSPGGGQVIPLTGFVLSVPADDPHGWLRSLQAGWPVSVGHDFSGRHGRVMEAMACGPSLVRSGSADVDFGAEDFGQQDSTVMSFFLPRTVETYAAARSFLGLRDGTLILGTVSGAAYGFGRAGPSGGMTFGELAQLCVDLGMDDAYALDGGGSSSLVAREGGAVRVLNTPTGGADVGRGEERFINTYWLVFER